MIPKNLEEYDTCPQCRTGSMIYKSEGLYCDTCEYESGDKFDVEFITALNEEVIKSEEFLDE